MPRSAPSRPDTATTVPASGLVPGPRPAGLGSGGRTAVLLGLVALLLATMALSLFVGSGDISPAEAYRALTEGGTSPVDIIVRDYRVPRTLLGVLAGSALGTAGVLTQALTRNPLADPGILGVNAGAYFAAVLGAAFFGALGTAAQIPWAFAGAVLVALLVAIVGGRGREGSSPVTLLLTGLAIGAVLNGIGYAITLTHRDAFDRLRHWQVGSLQGRQMDSVLAVLPYILIGLLIAVLLVRALNGLALGEERARSLGVPVPAIRVVGLLAVTLLCAAATAGVGPITFLGLMVPHAVRALVGPDHRWTVPLSLLGAPIVLLGADILGRLLLGSELPAGLVVAFVGAPVLILLVRRRRLEGAA